MLSTILGSSLVFIDGTVVGIALPVMQRELHATGASAQWIVEAYTLVLGAMMLLGGGIGDRYGRKRVFIIGIVIFLAGSVWCGLAQSIDMAIIARVVQGIGGTLMAPASLAIIGSFFEGAERDKAVGTWSAFTSITSIISPVLGGALVSFWGWRSVFFINVPLGIVTAFIAFRHVPESRDEAAQGRLDVFGSALVALGLGGIVYSLTDLSAAGASLSLVASTGILGAVLLLLFIRVEATTAHPLLPLRLFASPIFAGVNVATLFLYGALSAIFYFLPFDLIQVHGYSPAFTGLAMLPLVLTIALMSRESAALLERTGPRPLLTLGTAIAAVGMALFTILPRSADYWIGLFPVMLTIGVGMGLVVAPLTATMIDSVPEENVGVASGVNNAITRIGALLAIAIAGAVLWSSFNAKLDARLNAMQASTAQRAQVQAQRSRLAAGTYRDPQIRRAVNAAYDASFNEVALLSAALAAAASLCAFVTLASASPRRASPRPSH